MKIRRVLVLIRNDCIHVRNNENSGVSAVPTWDIRTAFFGSCGFLSHYYVQKHKTKTYIVNLELIKTWLDRPQSSFSQNGSSETFFMRKKIFPKSPKIWILVQNIYFGGFYQKLSKSPNLTNNQFSEFRQNFQSPQTWPTVNFSNFGKKFHQKFQNLTIVTWFKHKSRR